MRRRDFIWAACAAAVPLPLAVRAQQTMQMRRIGILLTQNQERATIDPVLQGLEQLGYR